MDRLENREAFLDYTLSRMDDPRIVVRFEGLKLKCEGLLQKSPDRVAVLDIGCGMGIQSRLWARNGYRVTGCDIDEDLVGAAREKAREEGLDIEWVVGSASKTTLPDEAFDVCLAVELLEHVDDWRGALQEFQRVLRPGGILVLTTTNAICPVQAEFRLPLYSWWPSLLKRKAVERARTTHPELANYTDFPALHWFTYWGLKRELESLGFVVKDRIDVMDLNDKRGVVGALVRAARRFDMLRWGAYLFLDGTAIFARKEK